MIVSTEMVSKVKRQFGLNMYEARLWLALISKGMSTAGELSELGNVPRSRTYDVLDSLEKKGLIAVKRETRPLKYIAIPLEQAIDNSKSHARKLAETKKNELASLDGELKVLASLFAESERNTEATERIGVLKSRENVMHHTSGMIRSAQKEITIAAPSKELAFLAENQLGVLEEAKTRGVQIRITTDGEVPLELARVANVKKTNGSHRMVVRDGVETLFMLFPHGEMHEMYDAGIWLTSPYFTNAVSSLLSHATA